MIEQISKKSINKCIKCNEKLGYYIKGKIKYEYFSINPKIINGKEYYRIICIDCFLKEFNRYPKSPNVTNSDFIYLLNISKDIILEKNKSKAITLKNMILKYGEIEGEKKFNEYREKQSYTNTFEYKQLKYNWTEKQFKEYNNSRAITLKNMILKYGKEKGTKKFNEYREKQSYRGNKLEYFIEKYGDEEGREKYKILNIQKKLNLDTFIRKYGEEEGEEKYNEFLAKFINCSSKISQEFFKNIYNELPLNLQEHCYFASNNKEFHKYDAKNKRNVFFDFVISNLKYCIEFNGEHVHPNKKLLTEEEWNKWKNPWNKEITADIKYKSDIEKLDVLKNLGFTIKIIWFKDYIKNPNKITNELINEILLKSKELI